MQYRKSDTPQIKPILIYGGLWTAPGHVGIRTPSANAVRPVCASLVVLLFLTEFGSPNGEKNTFLLVLQIPDPPDKRSWQVSGLQHIRGEVVTARNVEGRILLRGMVLYLACMFLRPGDDK